MTRVKFTTCGNQFITALEKVVSVDRVPVRGDLFAVEGDGGGRMIFRVDDVVFSEDVPPCALLGRTGWEETSAGDRVLRSKGWTAPGEGVGPVPDIERERAKFDAAKEDAMRQFELAERANVEAADLRAKVKRRTALLQEFRRMPELRQSSIPAVLDLVMRVSVEISPDYQQDGEKGTVEESLIDDVGDSSPADAMTTGRAEKKTMTVTKNAVVAKAEIFADHTCTHVTLVLDYGDGTQQVGPYLLTEEILRKILGAAGTRRWSELAGRAVRVVRDDRTSEVTEIGHFLTNDAWGKLVER